MTAQRGEHRPAVAVQAPGPLERLWFRVGEPETLAGIIGTVAIAGFSFAFILVLCVGLLSKNRANKESRIYYMTRRDYFAANAMNALLSRCDISGKEAVKEAFARADEALER